MGFGKLISVIGPDANIEVLPGGNGRDVLVYLGDLTKLFAQIRARLKPQGLWVFTTEKSENARERRQRQCCLW